MLKQSEEVREELWRVGKSIPINVYDGDRPVCQCHTVADARRIVEAVNAMDYYEEAIRQRDEFKEAAYRLENTISLLRTEAGTIGKEPRLNQFKQKLAEAIPTTAPAWRCSECGHIMPSVPGEAPPVRCSNRSKNEDGSMVCGRLFHNEDKTQG